MQNIRDNLIYTVKYLAHDIGERSYPNIDKLNETADFIEETFRAYKCKPSRQTFSYKGNIFSNIIAEVKGSDPSQKEIIVVGAHYDTVPGTPGADDNASGVAGLLELARLAEIRPPLKTMHFAAFTLEEPPSFMTRRMGSHKYAELLKKEATPVYGMISLEMLGYYCDRKGCQYFPIPLLKWFYPDTGNYITFVSNVHSKSFTMKLKNAFGKSSAFPVETMTAPSVIPGVDFSDHHSFWKFGYQAVMVTDTAFYRNPNYHGPGDTETTLDYHRMELLICGLSKALDDL